jgi:CNP1-like family protein
VKRHRAFLLPTLLVLSACTSFSQPKQFPDDGFDNKPWEIQQAQLPRYPEQSGLVQIYVSPTTTFQFFVDAVSIAVSDDGPVRYTLVARSPSGAANVSYEGISCETHSYKLYAIGRPDGTWSQVLNPQWTAIRGQQANRQHATLAEDFFCSQRGRVRTTKDAIEALRQGANGGVVR